MAVAAPDIAYLQRLLGPLLTSVISDYILLHPNGGDGNAAKEVGRALLRHCQVRDETKERLSKDLKTKELVKAYQTQLAAEKAAREKDIHEREAALLRAAQEEEQARQAAKERQAAEEKNAEQAQDTAIADLADLSIADNKENPNQGSEGVNETEDENAGSLPVELKTEEN